MDFLIKPHLPTNEGLVYWLEATQREIGTLEEKLKALLLSLSLLLN